MQAQLLRWGSCLNEIAELLCKEYIPSTREHGLLLPCCDQSLLSATVQTGLVSVQTKCLGKASGPRSVTREDEQWPVTIMTGNPTENTGHVGMIDTDT